MFINTVDQRIKEAEQGLDQSLVIDVIMERFGMRFADVIQITRDDIIDNTTVFFAAKKGGYDRWEALPDLIHILLRINAITLGKCIFSVTYRQHYRWCRKRYPKIKKPGRVKSVVTHRHRNNYAKKLHASRKGEKDSISRKLGQRTNKSIDYYL